MKRILLLLCLFPALFAGAAVAAKPSDASQQIEASMVVTGSINVEPDGSVSGYKLDRPEKLPQGVVDLVAKAVPAWAFEPVLVGGKAVPARAKMSLLVFARQLAPERYEIGIRSANFGDEGRARAAGESTSAKKMDPPRYPSEAGRLGVSGIAYVVVRIGRDGRVEDAMIEQVNLKTMGSPEQMAAWRDGFAKASLAAARKWTFHPPTVGEEVDAPYWLARVPTDYETRGTSEVAYGKWNMYLPGPRTLVPWQDIEQSSASSPDATDGSGVYSLRQSLHLLTPLGNG